MKYLCFLLPFTLLSSVPAADLQLVLRRGVPIEDRKEAWPGHVDFASWIDDDFIVYASRGDIVGLSVKADKALWTVRKQYGITGWSCSRATKRVAVSTEVSVSVIDCTNGKKLFSADESRLAELLQRKSVNPSRIAFASTDGQLVVCNFSSAYGRNAYILDPEYKRVLSSFLIDAVPREVSLSPDGTRVAVVAEEVLCVHDVRESLDLLRIKSGRSATDAPFYSHLRVGDGDDVIYTQDNSWSTGKVLVHNLKTKKTDSFDARNGHIEMDVLFPSRRIALTGTSTDLNVVDFEGAVLAHKKKVTLQRNRCVEFSPSGKRILVGSWDNTLSVFALAEDGK